MVVLRTLVELLTALRLASLTLVRSGWHLLVRVPFAAVANIPLTAGITTLVETLASTTATAFPLATVGILNLASNPVAHGLQPTLNGN